MQSNAWRTTSADIWVLDFWQRTLPHIMDDVIDLDRFYHNGMEANMYMRETEQRGKAQE